MFWLCQTMKLNNSNCPYEKEKATKIVHSESNILLMIAMNSFGLNLLTLNSVCYTCAGTISMMPEIQLQKYSRKLGI